MKRSRRWLFNGIVALSLALCLTTAGMWVCSYSHFYNVVCYESDGRTDTPYAYIADWELDSWRGQVRITKFKVLNRILYQVDNAGPVRPRLFFTEVAPPAGSLCAWSSLGFGFNKNAGEDDWYNLSNGGTSIGFAMDNQRSLIIPLYAPVVMCVIPMFFWLRSYLRRKALVRSGFCNQCGYDLRASPERCPECGKIPSIKELTSS